MITERPYQEDRAWVIPSMVRRAWKLRVRQASCYCSVCRDDAFNDCKVASIDPGLVGAVRTVAVEEKATVRSVATQTDQ